MLNLTVALSGNDGTVNTLRVGVGVGRVTIVVPIDRMFSVVTMVLWKLAGVTVVFSLPSTCGGVALVEVSVAGVNVSLPDLVVASDE